MHEMKKEYVKEQILLKIEEKLLMQNFNDIRIDAIAQELRISKRTIYELFESKDDIFKNVIQRHNEYCVKIAEKTIANIKDKKITLYDGLKELSKLLQKNTVFSFSDIVYKFHDICTEIKQKQNEFIDTFLDIAIEHNIIRASLDKKICYLIIKSLNAAVFDPKIIDEYELDFPKLKEIHKIIFYGILSDEARKDKNLFWIE
jgi:AcrR family transcriptional regulator